MFLSAHCQLYRCCMGWLRCWGNPCKGSGAGAVNCFPFTMNPLLSKCALWRGHLGSSHVKENDLMHFSSRTDDFWMSPCLWLTQPDTRLNSALPKHLEYTFVCWCFPQCFQGTGIRLDFVIFWEMSCIPYQTKWYNSFLSFFLYHLGCTPSPILPGINPSVSCLATWLLTLVCW